MDEGPGRAQVLVGIPALLRDVRIGAASRGLTDLRTDGLTIKEVGKGLLCRGETVIDGAGSIVQPGLHDHHLHLLAMAAEFSSVQCSEDVMALARAPSGAGWLRGVGCLASLDRWALDAIVADRPVRVQHASGALWMLNSAAVRSVAHALTGEGVERDADGRAYRQVVEV